MRSKLSHRGFSFIEVMFALVVLSISLVILMDSQARSLDLVSRTQQMDRATQLAAMKMAELSRTIQDKGISSLRKEERGEFDQEKYPGYSWLYQVLDVPAPDFGAMLGTLKEEGEDVDQGNAGLLAGPLQSISKAWGESLKELRLEVSWMQGDQARSLTLATHFIAPTATGSISNALRGIGISGSESPQP